ncbi:MAG TPA: hypothetical protein VKA03_02945 [Methylovirgula sp.]|nr:hypothetical protein [Methylovirgula sp.]
MLDARLREIDPIQAFRPLHAEELAQITVREKIFGGTYLIIQANAWPRVIMPTSDLREKCT